LKSRTELLEFRIFRKTTNPVRAMSLDGFNNFEDLTFLQNNGTNSTDTFWFGWPNTTWGYIFTMISVLCFGSFNIPLKLERTQKANPEPMIFQIYMSTGIFLTSWIVCAYTDFVFTVWGLLSAALWVTASIMSIFAITNVGLAVSQGLWSGGTIIISFLWGVLYFNQHPKDLVLSIVALAVIVIGITGVSIAGSNLLVKKQKIQERKALLQEESDDSTIINSSRKPETPKKSLLLGCLLALGLSIPNGTMLVPIKLAPVSVQGINFIVSFGIGVICVTPIYAIIYYIILRKKPSFKLYQLAIPGTIAGVGWNIGNWASIYATLFLGFTIGFPLSQCALLVGGFWGLVLFREITGGVRVLLFVFSSFTVIGGAVLLGMYGS